MGKGDVTRSRILERAVDLAGLGGIEHLSVGVLATELKMSKSGLFRHFRSKEQLQLEILGRAVDRFVERVVSPALKKPRGTPRLRALFDNWRRWDESLLPGGCFFNAVGAEISTLPTSVQDALIDSQQDWFQLIATMAGAGVSSRSLRKDLDTEAFAFEFIALTKGHHHLVHLMRDPRAKEFSLAALDRLLERSTAG